MRWQALTWGLEARGKNHHGHNAFLQEKATSIATGLRCGVSGSLVAWLGDRGAASGSSYWGILGASRETAPEVFVSANFTQVQYLAMLSSPTGP